MTAATITTPADEAAQAEAAYLAAETEAVAADEAAEHLAERVREGDDSVTPEQLDTAQKAGKFARLRAEAAQRKARKAAERAEQARRRTLTEQAVTLLDKQSAPATVADAYETARRALAALVAAVDRHDDTVTEAACLLAQADAPPSIRYERVEHGGGYATQEPRPATASRTAPTVSYDAHGHPLALSVDTGKSRSPLHSGSVLGTLLADVTAASQPRTPMGETEFMRRPITEQAHQHGDRVRAFLTDATKGAAA
ncbi:hypothetical protein [Streptomyces mutabilis]|uniref:Uncharacterized protein n=1 Tax=Streptomyces mutabilis TaxID=67332 RepID=A0A086N3D9_9ACTN|nr:hypothetical protein [Streptomyces mutabilis]KFG75657.1 hypothetical protein FM21_05910 [Streptomyces mutabilis]